MRLTTSDGIRLEARGDGVTDGTRICVFCHPHPRYGGSMNAPLMEKVTEHLVAAEWGVLRFNFRGVGSSTGRHDAGVGELRDVEAAMAAAQDLAGGRPTSLAGWSFGAAVALRWQAAAGDQSPYAGIAPAVSNPFSPPLPGAAELPAARRGFVIGDRDQYTSVAAITSYADSIGADVSVLEGSDHFFFFREQQVAAALAAVLGDDAPPEPG